jgi:hypothetical protein
VVREPGGGPFFGSTPPPAVVALKGHQVAKFLSSALRQNYQQFPPTAALALMLLFLGSIIMFVVSQLFDCVEDDFVVGMAVVLVPALCLYS